MKTPEKPSLDEVWRRIRALQGEPFETKTGRSFTYAVVGSTLQPSRTRYRIGKADFGKAYESVPLDGPGVISRTVRGPAYVWAVLHDRRVRRDDW